MILMLNVLDMERVSLSVNMEYVDALPLHTLKELLVSEGRSVSILPFDVMCCCVAISSSSIPLPNQSIFISV